MIFDGHARSERDADQEWPVLVTDLTRDEADKMLLALDPIAAMAGADEAALSDLLGSVETASDGLSEMFKGLADLASAGVDPNATGGDPGFSYSSQYGVVVMCDGEAEQAAAYDRLVEMGFECKVVTV